MPGPVPMPWMPAPQVATLDAADAASTDKTVPETDKMAVTPLKGKSLAQPDPIPAPAKTSIAHSGVQVNEAPVKALQSKSDASEQADSAPQVSFVVMDTPMGAAAAHQTPAEMVVEVAEAKPAIAAMMATPKETSEKTPFDIKRLVVYPLLILAALASLAVWLVKRKRSPRSPD